MTSWPGTPFAQGCPQEEGMSQARFPIPVAAIEAIAVITTALFPPTLVRADGTAELAGLINAFRVQPRNCAGGGRYRRRSRWLF